MSTVRYHWDISDADNHLDALINGPDVQSAFLFESVVMEQYADVKADVHIMSGSLLLSGTADTDYGYDEWEGTISFGGPTTGEEGEVTYAHIEMDRVGKRRFYEIRDGEDEGTSHNFFRSAKRFNKGYVEVIKLYYGQSGRSG